MTEAFDKIQALIKSGEPPGTVWTEVLHLILGQFQSETGTLHRLDPQTQLLHLVAQAGLPPHLLEIVRTIPVGKGIAGQAAAQNRPVTICNLQSDTSGVARPGAKQTGVGGARCVPVHDTGQLVGTLGIGTRREHEYTPEETAALEKIGRLLAAALVS